MTNRARTALLLACLAAPMPSGSARSEGAMAIPPAMPASLAAEGVVALHATWQGCLRRSFGVQATLTSPVLAADGALRACRPSEDAYLAALSASPLVDDEDVARVRPALLARARGWLLGQRSSRSL